MWSWTINNSYVDNFTFLLCSLVWFNWLDLISITLLPHLNTSILYTHNLANSINSFKSIQTLPITFLVQSTFYTLGKLFAKSVGKLKAQLPYGLEYIKNMFENMMWKWLSRMLIERYNSNEETNIHGERN